MTQPNLWTNPGRPLQLLVVEDEPKLAVLVCRYLDAAGFQTGILADGRLVVNAVRTNPPDLVLLDLMLPGLDGVEICRLIRSESDVPIIMLTARTDTQDVVAGLEAGADDYVTKPFKSKELLARVSTRLRRTNPGAAEHVRAGDLDIDVAGHQVKRGESVISLTPLEFELLVTLARSPWKVFTREELLSQVWKRQTEAFSEYSL